MISATNRKLREDSDDGRFSRDLYFPIRIPPLRNRIEDIPLLAEQFLERLARKLGHRRLRLTLANVQQIQNYCWPGNVRELQLVLERATIGAADGKLRIELAKDSPKKTGQPPASTVTECILTESEMRDLEAQNIRLALKASKGKIYGPDGAAAQLGIKPTTLASRIKALGVRLDSQ